MKENKHLFNIDHYFLFFIKWCLFVTTFVTFELSNAQSSSFFYDSALQRSNFMSLNPSYIDQLEDEIKERRALFLWKMRFDGQGLHTDKNIQSQKVGATIRTRFKYKVMENINFHANANLSLESGRSQSIFGDLEPSSGIYPKELRLSLGVIPDYVEVNVGQIYQRWINEPLFVGDLGFPGAQEKIGYHNKRFSIELLAQQLIPTSSTLSTRVTVREQTPQLYTASLRGLLNLSKNNFVSGSVTNYNYSTLPHIVAYYGQVYGNSGTGGNQNNATLTYGFNGFITQLTIEQKISNSLASQLRWSTIKNNRAPSQNSDAQSFDFYLANDFGRWILSGTYKNYFIESDAVPSFYNSHALGHTNRIGNAFELNYESKTWGVIFKGQYVKANLLSPNLAVVDGLQQDNQQTFYFSMETLYDFI